MTGEQQAADAFDTEWQHLLAGLPARPCLSNHAGILQHHRCELHILELLQYYSRKLPAYLYGPRILAAGKQLVDRKEHQLAADACFKRLVALDLPGTPDTCRKLDAAGRLALHVQALYGVHACHVAEALLRDERLQHQHTVAAALLALAGIRDACRQALPAQPLIVYQGTQHLHGIAQKLVAVQLHKDALPFLLFAAGAMECHVSLCCTQYLPWRVQLYAATAACYAAVLSSMDSKAAAQTLSTSAGQHQGCKPGSDAASSTSPVQPVTGVQADGASIAEEARAALAGGLAKLADIARAQALDAVPAPEMFAAIQAAQAQMLLLQVLFDEQSASGEQPGQGAAAQLQACLTGIGHVQQRLAALLGLLRAGLAGHACPWSKVQLPHNLQPAMAAAAELAHSALTLDARDRPSDGLSEHLRLGEARPGEPAKLGLFMELLCVAYRYQQHDLLQQLLTAAVRPACSAAVQQEPGSDTAASSTCLEATAAVLAAVVQLQQSPGDIAMQQLAAALFKHSAAVSSCMPTLVPFAALELHEAASKHLEGCFDMADGNADLVHALLEGLHEALQQCSHADGVLRGSVALRLAAMLEQQQHYSRALSVAHQGMAAIVAARSDALHHLQGHVDEHLRWISGSRTQPDDATADLLTGMSDTEQVLACLHADVIMLSSRLELKLGLQEAAAKTVARQQRLQASLQKRDEQADIFGARTCKERRLDAIAMQKAGQAPTNALDVEQRLLVNCGKCCYQQALVLGATALMHHDTSRQAALLEEACDALQSAHTSEAELFAFQQPGKETLRPLSAHHLRPIQPKILCRTPNSITLAPFPVKVTGNTRQPAAFAAYCKPCAAGVSLTVNKTSTEYPGTGVQVAIGERVTIEGLQSCEAYNFAVAVYDDQGNMLGELGISSPAVTMSLPLPIYYCYAQLLLAAANLGLWVVAKKAAKVLLPRFFTTSSARPLWQAHPADRFGIQQVAAQVAPFLRLLVQAVYAYTGHLGTQQLQLLAAHDGDPAGCSQGAAAGLAGTAGSRALLLSLSESHIPQQVALLEIAQRHLMAMQVAATAGDEMLVEEGAIRTFQLLSSLLQQQDISPALFQPLSELHTLLAAVKDSAPATIAGQQQQRQQAAQTLAATSYWRLKLLEPVRTDLACGSFAVATNNVLGLKLKPSAGMTALEGALLHVLGGKSIGLPDASASAATSQDTNSPPKAAKGSSKKQHKQLAGQKGAMQAAGAAATPVAEAAEQAEELRALHELLLWHPNGPLWAAEMHASRCQDPSDLVAQVLPRLHQPHALTACWPLLSAPTAQSHSRWLPLCVMLMQAAADQHGAALWLSLPAEAGHPVGISANSLPAAARFTASPQLTAAAVAASELVQSVKEFVRLSARRPQFVCWPSRPKWSVEDGAAALEAEGFALGDQGTAAPQPQPELPAGAAADVKAAANAAWQQQNAALLLQERRRLAAVLLLQQRLPVLWGRRKVILAARRQLAAWAPWLARLHSITGDLAAEAAAQVIALVAPAALKLGPDTPAGPMQPSEAAVLSTDAAPTTPSTAAVPAGGSRPGSTLTSPRKSGPDSSRPQTAAQAGTAATTQASSKADFLQEPAHQLALQAFSQFAQAVTLAARASQPQHLFSISQQFHTVSTYLLDRLPGLLTAASAVQWSLRALPDIDLPVLVAAAPERLPPDSAAAKGVASDKKTAAGGKAAAAGEKKQPGTGSKGARQGTLGATTPRTDAKHTLLPDAQKPHAGIPLRSVMEALLAGLEQMKDEASKHSASKDQTCAGSNNLHAPGPSATGAGSATARSCASNRSAATASVFSFGSDALIDRWHDGSSVDIQGLTQVVAAVLKALHSMGRWPCMLRLGTAWLSLCQGSADGVLVPLLLSAARNAGSAADVAVLTSAGEALAGDKNIVLEELAKVRALAAERLSGVNMLNRLEATATGSSVTHCATGISSLAAQSLDATQPDAVLLVGAYEKVVKQLKQRGEKGHMILALNELGDVHAHHGSSRAGDAWSSAVDALLGPYHVVETWSIKLELGKPADLLRCYGVHGLLLAVTLLGKLARHTHHSGLGSRLSCALLAAELLPAVCAGDIIHPQRRLDFAAYVPVEIWPGEDVFDDPFRCNPAALVSSLECLSGVLQEQQLHLLMLPLLAIWEHVALYITHDKASTVLARITRVRALAALGLMPQAAVALKGLMLGANLPGLLLGPPQPLLDQQGVTVGLSAAKACVPGETSTRSPAGAQALVEVDVVRPQLYNADKPPSHPGNAAFLQFVTEAVVDPAVVEAYGPWLCGHLVLTRAAFLAAAGAAVDCWVSNRPAAIAQLVAVGPPPAPTAADTTAAAAVGEAHPSGAGAPAPAAQQGPTSGAKGSKAAAATANSASSPAAAVAQGAKATTGGPPHAAATSQPGSAELKLLAAAAQLLQGVVAGSCAACGMSATGLGLPWAEHGAADGKAAGSRPVPSRDKASPAKHGSTASKGAHSPGKAGKAAGGQKHGKGSAGTTKAGGAQQDHEQESDADSSAASMRAAAAAELLAAQHQELLIKALLQLSAVQAARWMPLQALPACLAVCEAVKAVAGNSGGSIAAWTDRSGDNSMAEAKASLQPNSSTWLAARLQVAQVLLQLHHHIPCANVCLKALTDAARVGDVAWTVRLLGVQANALAAQEDHLGALNAYRAALSRAAEHDLPGALLLPLQLDYAALCDEVGARGDFDRLSAAALLSSTDAVESMGLLEMMEHPELRNIYLPAISTHLTALLQAATASTRRRQLATAERQLRAAAQLLSCCRGLPVHAAAVLTSLARVLRLQAALKLPSMAVLGCATQSVSGAGLPAHPAVQGDRSDTALAKQEGKKGSGSSSVSAADVHPRRLQEAVHLLRTGLQVLIEDAGSNPCLVRSALLELAAVWVQAVNVDEQRSGTSVVVDPTPGAAAQVAAALQAANVTAGQVCKLLLESHSLQPVQAPGSNLPEWLLELLKGHEQLQGSRQQEAAAAAAATAAGADSKAMASVPDCGSSSAASATADKQHQQAGGAEAHVLAGCDAASALPAVADATLGRLAVCFYVQQLAGMATGAAGLQQQQRAAEQLLLLQPVLRTSCAKFASDCCWPCVPPEVAAALKQGPAATNTTLAAPGTVVLQWYRQDGCWQAPSSWCCHGALPLTGQLDAGALHALPRQQPCISCLYMLVLPAAPAVAGDANMDSQPAGAAAGAIQASSTTAPGPAVLLGDLVLSLERAKRVQLQVKSMRAWLEAPGKVTDKYAKPAPSTAELAAVKHNLECLLSMVPEEDMPMPPPDLPCPPAPSQQALQSSAAAGPAPAASAPAKSAAAAAVTAKPPVTAKAGATAATAASAAAGPAGSTKAAVPSSAATAGGASSGSNVGGGGGVLDWRQLDTWVKMEVLMDLEGGLQATDAGVAKWLGELLLNSRGKLVAEPF